MYVQILDIKWIAVWCIKFKVLFGHMDFPGSTAGTDQEERKKEQQESKAKREESKEEQKESKDLKKDQEGKKGGTHLGPQGLPFGPQSLPSSEPMYFNDELLAEYQPMEWRH